MSEAVKLKPFEIALEVISGPHAGARFSFADKELITIGRGPENDIVLANDPRVSRLHAEIKFSDENYYIYNKANKNYILINGIKDEQALVANKAMVTIGESEIKIQFPSLGAKTVAVANPLQPLEGKKNPLQVISNDKNVAQAKAHLNIAQQPHLQQPYLQQPLMGGVAQASPLRAKKSVIKKKSNDSLFYIGLLVVVVTVLFIMLPQKNEEKVKNSPIVTPILEEEVRLKKSEEALEKSRERLKNLDSRKMMARQFLVSGMREYNNGQYHKAIEYLASSFQSDPSLEEAAKYHLKAKQNLDKLIDNSFTEGKKYRESGNYRMCKSSFQTVLFYIKNNIKHPRYVEAKQYYDECTSLDEVGRL